MSFSGILNNVKRWWAGVHNYFSPRHAKLLLSGKNNSKHTLKCDWLFMDWGEVSVKVNIAMIDVRINGAEQISSIDAVVSCNNSVDNLRRGLFTIKPGLPAVVRIRPDWPWGRPEYDAVVDIKTCEQARCGARTIFTGKIVQLLPRRNEFTLLFPAFDRRQQQQLTLANLVQMASKGLKKKAPEPVKQEDEKPKEEQPKEEGQSPSPECN